VGTAVVVGIIIKIMRMPVLLLFYPLRHLLEEGKEEEEEGRRPSTGRGVYVLRFVPSLRFFVPFFGVRSLCG